MVIAWTDEWCVGNDLLDSQHKQLVDYVNRAEVIATSTEHNSSERFHELLNDVALYVRNHFDDEEDILRFVGYDKLAEQIKEHDSLNLAMTDFLVKASVGQLEKLEFAKFLQEWMSHHVLEVDMQYKSVVSDDAK